MPSNVNSNTPLIPVTEFTEVREASSCLSRFKEASNSPTLKKVIRVTSITSSVAFYTLSIAYFVTLGVKLSNLSSWPPSELNGDLEKMKDIFILSVAYLGGMALNAATE